MIRRVEVQSGINTVPLARKPSTSVLFFSILIYCSLDFNPSTVYSFSSLNFAVRLGLAERFCSWRSSDSDPQVSCVTLLNAEVTASKPRH